jgi:hypothetical protein
VRVVFRSRFFEVDIEIVNAIASNYRTIVNLDLRTCYTSSSNILKIVECIPLIEHLVFTNFLGTDLERSDIEALASLPRLKFEIDDLYVMPDDIIPSLSLLNGLKHLEIRWSEELANILPSIGRNLVSLNVRSATAETWLGIVENC